MRNRPAIAAFLLCLAAAAVPAPAAERFLVIDMTGASRVMDGLVIDAERVYARDEQGVMRSRPVTDVLAIMRTDPGTRLTYPGLLITVDGQRLPGHLTMRTATRPDAFVWMHPWMGQVEATLEQTREIMLDGSTRIADDRTRVSDVVILRNGDRIEGLVAAVGDPFEIEIDQGGTVRTMRIPLERVAAVRLVTPDIAPSGERLWFRDGTVVQVSDRRIGDDGYVRLRSAWLREDRPIQVSLGEIDAIEVGAGLLVPLAGLAPVDATSSYPRFEIPSPRVASGTAVLGTHPVEMRGPLVVRYRLPERCHRFVATVSMPERARQYGDCDLILRSNGTEVFRRRFGGDMWTAPIDVALSGRDFQVEITVGEHGPVQDVLLFERAIFIRTP